MSRAKSRDDYPEVNMDSDSSSRTEKETTLVVTQVEVESTSQPGAPEAALRARLFLGVSCSLGLMTWKMSFISRLR